MELTFAASVARGGGLRCASVRYIYFKKVYTIPSPSTHRFVPFELLHRAEANVLRQMREFIARRESRNVRRDKRMKLVNVGERERERVEIRDRLV